MSEQVGDLVGCGDGSLVLVREALGELTAVALTLLFELDQVVHSNATVTADAMERNLATIEELVEVRAAHAKSLSSLDWSNGLRAVDYDDFIAFAYTTAQAHEDIAKLGSSRVGELIECVKLVGRDIGGLKHFHDAPIV